MVNLRVTTRILMGVCPVLLVLSHASLAAEPAADPGAGLLPKPVEVKVAAGTCRITAKTVIQHDDNTAGAARLLQADLAARTGLKLKLVTGAPKDAASILLQSVPAGKPGEYTLAVAPNSITIQAATPVGRFHGTRTLLQLIAAAGPGPIPCVHIRDHPRFRWRGLMLDCSRTFQSVEYVRKTIDRMAYYKMNSLHLHLTDDQGWRLEIRKHPELTRKGARFPAKWNEPARHQGFYTQAQMKALIAYAAARGITIVPEIELPGHSLAALACYPKLSCTGKQSEIHPFFKGPCIHREIFCAGNDATFAFLEDVLAEVIELFPSKLIHIGGDEAPKNHWKACAKCQKRIAAEGLKDEHELQSYFIKRIEKFVNAKGRQIIGWDEILEGGLAPKAAVMSWRGTRGGVTAASAGHDVVMSPSSHCYFDYTYGRISTQRAYSFEPTAGLSDEQAKHVLGLQANFWSHIDREEPRVDAQLFPRLLGIAERGWSVKTATDAVDFARRVNAQLPELERMGVAYHREVPRGAVIGQWSPKQMSETYAPLTWDATGQITGPGNVRIRLHYTAGAHRLGIERVELLADGKVIAVDAHRGVAGGSHSRNEYHLKLAVYRKAAKYTVRASARSEGGTDSNGRVYMRAIRE